MELATKALILKFSHIAGEKSVLVFDSTNKVSTNVKTNSSIFESIYWRKIQKKKYNFILKKPIEIIRYVFVFFFMM